MRTLAIIGVLLIVFGIVALTFQSITYFTTDRVVDFGPLKIDAERPHTIVFHPVAGAVAVIAGLVLVLAGGMRFEHLGRPQRLHPTGRLVGVPRAALRQRGLSEGANRRDLAGRRLKLGAVAPPAAAAALGISHPSRGGLGDDTKADLAILHECDHYRELTVLLSEAARAVDGVDDPQPVAGGGGGLERRRVFLGAEGIAGE